jgi:hypothetical protein
MSLVLQLQILLLLTFVPPPGGQATQLIPPDSVCSHRGTFSGPCVTVHGRMFGANGTPGVRIWKVGTGRVLGVYNETDTGTCRLPHELWTSLPSHVIYADFVVRPLAADRPGVMQMVCVASATKIVIRPIEPVSH